MTLSTNTKKIQKLFNDMQKAIIKFEELIIPHEYIAFDIYKIHISTLMEYVQDNVIAKLSLKLFQILFENKTEFSECTSTKQDHINRIINKLKAKSKDEKEEAQNDIESAIYPVLFNTKNSEKKEMTKELIIKLQKKLDIKCEIYYLLLVLLIESNYDVNILIDYLPQVLKEKYPDSTFDFSEAHNSGITFNEFIGKLFQLIERENNFNYLDCQFNIKKKEILVYHKSLDEIADIILTSTNKNKKGNANEIRKEKIEQDKKNFGNLQKSNNNNEQKNTSEISEENTQVSKKIESKAEENVKENSQNCEEVNNNTSEDLSIEEMKKIILDNKRKNIQLERKYDELKNDMSILRYDMNKVKADNKKLENDNKNLTKNISDAKKKIMQNSKRMKSLEYDLKIIGLRDAYKSFIDLLIIIMDLKPYGKTEDKIQTIINAIKNSNKNNTEKIKALLKDSNDILSHSNDKAHFINLNEDIIKQLLFNLSKFSGNKEYLSLIDTFKSLKIEDALKKLVENRLEKYKKSKESFINEQNIIKKSIEENPLVAKGKGFKTLMNN